MNYYILICAVVLACFALARLIYMLGKLRGFRQGHRAGWTDGREHQAAVEDVRRRMAVKQGWD